MSIRRLFATGVTVVIGLAAASAQQQGPPAPPRPQFRSSIDTVHLDVSVLDRNRRPVRGLTPADFTILEDGKPQQIAVFQAVDIRDPEPPSAPWIRDVAPDVAANDGLQERRLFLIVMDDVTIQANVEALNSARQIARQVIERFGPSDLAAVIFTRDNRGAQDFTADRARLFAAVDKFSAGFRDMGLFDADTQEAVPGQDDMFFQMSADVLGRAVDMLSSMPDRRKVIIYVGQGVPVDYGLLAPQGVGIGGALMQQTTMIRIRDQMEKAFQRALRANVNVYTLDTCGLRTPPAAQVRGVVKLPRSTCVPGLEQEYLRTVASNTGGRAVVDTNDFGPGVAAIFQENASYYLLGYRPPDPKQDGNFRRLEVRVNRRDVQVRTRSGYQAHKASDVRKRQAALAATPLGVALAGVLPKSDLPLQMSAIPMALPGKRESAVAVVVGVRQPIRETSGRIVERVDLQVSAFNVDGKSFGSRRLQADVAIRAGASGLAEYEVLSRIDLPPGRYQLRVAGNVGSLSTSGSLYYDVDVPDVTKAPVSLSGVVLSATPGPPVSPRNVLESFLPVVPTTRRTFAPVDRVAAFVRLYQGRKTPVSPVPIQVRVTDARDAVVMNSSQTVAAARFTPARSADIHVDLPVSRLANGEYLLTVEANLGGAFARRELRFRVAR
jgi:VWFA-related protein